MENKTTGHPKLLTVNTPIEGSNIDSIALNASFRAVDGEWISLDAILFLNHGWANIFYGGTY